VGTFASNYSWCAVYRNTGTVSGKTPTVVTRAMSTSSSYGNPMFFINNTMYITGSNQSASVGGCLWNSPYNVYNTNTSIFNAFVHQTAAVSYGAFTNGTHLVFTPVGTSAPLKPYGDGGNIFLIGTEASLGGITAFNGFFHEVIVYNTELTGAQRQTVEGYLAWKWGLQNQLPPFHMYASTAPNSTTSLNLVFPQTLPGLQLWLDGKDPLGTGSAPANGATLTYLADKSGNSYKTTFETQNSLQGVYYYGQALTTNPTGTYTAGTYPYITAMTSVPTCIVSRIPAGTFFGNTTVFIVYNSYANVSAPLFTRTIPPGPGQVGNLGNPVENQGTSFYIGSNNATTFSTGYSFYIPSRSIQNVNINQNTGTLSILSNGSSKYSGTATLTPSDGGSIFTLFARGDLGTNTTLSANLNEALVFNSALTIEQTQRVEGYLAWKWGIQTQLPAGHPYISSAPV
jgi:hypothetical protein